MPGSWLVDGYNVVFHRSKVASNGPAHRLRKARESLLELLTKFHEITGDAVTVVFDGSIDPLGYTEDRTFQGAIEVVWSPQGKSADDTIRGLLDRRKAMPTLVTSDRELAASGRQRGCTVVGAADYLARAAEETGGTSPGPAAKPPPKPDPDVRAKRDGISTDEAEQWRKQFGLDEEVEL